MVDSLSDLDRVYAKWEGNSPYIANGKSDSVLSPRTDYNPAEGKGAWNPKVGNNIAPQPVRKSLGRTWGERNSDLMKIDPRLVSFII